MTIAQRSRVPHRSAVRAMRPARVALILEMEYRRAQRDLRQRRKPAG